MSCPLDLVGIEKWEHIEVCEALEEVDDGFTDSQVTWVDRLARALRLSGSWSTREREIAEDILKQWNERQET